MTKFVCKSCGYGVEESPSDADTWTCPVCGTSNPVEAAPLGENWLDGLCHYSGPGHDLPLGGFSKIPHFKPESLVQSWLVVADGETVSKKTKELTPTDIILGVTMAPEALKSLVATYGEDFYQIREANGGPLMTLAQWQTEFGTNGLGLVAIRNMRLKLAGPGVHF